MNSQKSSYTQFGLVADMLAVPNLIRSFDPDRMQATSGKIAEVGRLLLTGEGSSRLFPAKSIIAEAHRKNWPIKLHTEAGLQAREYELSNWAVMGLSNSGRTTEVIALFDKLKQENHPHLYSLTARANSKLESFASAGYLLTCGEEHAVAATKSVTEQALFLWALVAHSSGSRSLAWNTESLATSVESALTMTIDPALIQRIAGARTIYWAGRNDGVAEELTLKTNEITRKSANYLEGTYAVHGIEEVLDPDDVIIWVNPYISAQEKFQAVLSKDIGTTIIAIASQPTLFPTILIPEEKAFSPFVQMAAGWNLLVETGLHLHINLDKPLRARKVGNDYEPI